MVRYKEVLRGCERLWISKLLKETKWPALMQEAKSCGAGIVLELRVSQSAETATAGISSWGGEQMILEEEKELEIIRRGLTYVQVDSHSD